MRYNNKFFTSREEAKAFQKEHGGVYLRFNPKCHDSKMDFFAEMAVARDARCEEIDPSVTPYCIAWNERN